MKKKTIRNVVVTGLGVVSSIGSGIDEFWKSVKEGKNGIDKINLDGMHDCKVSLASCVKDFNIQDFCPDIKNTRRLEKFSQFAIVAASQAVKDSNIDLKIEDPYRIGTCIGCGIGGLDLIGKSAIDFNEKGSRGVPPLVIPMILSNMASANVGIYLHLMGKNIDVVTACASGNNCIGEAMRTIQYGDADVMLAGGTESAINPLALMSFAALSALSLSGDKDRASIPFDKERGGFVMGEGAGVLVLEEEERAIKRGAKIYARLLGYGTSCDAYHITSPLQDGSAQAKCMKNAIDDAGLKPSDINYVNAHGTGTKYNDIFETKAIKLCFGKSAKNLKINSTKSMIGHLLGAAGGVEAVVLAKTISEKYIHKTINFKVPDEECDLNYMTSSAENTDVRYGISNGFGFGGHNATILMGAY